MAYKLIEKFAESLGEHHTTVIVGPLSPLFIQLPWSKNPAAPLSTFLINRGRETVLVVDEYYYHLLCEDQFRNYFEKKVTKEELERSYYAYAEATQAIYDEAIQIDFSTLDEAALLAFFKRMMAIWERVADTVYIETLDYDMALRVVGEANKPLLDTVWEQAIHPTFLSFDGRRLAHLLKAVKDADELSSIIPGVRYIYTDYHWTKSDTEILAELEEIRAHLSEKERELESVYKDVAKRKAAHDAWEKSLTSEGKFLVEFIQMIMLFRDIRKDPIAQTQAVFVEIVTELLQRAGIDPKYALALNIYECARGIEYLKSIKDELIKRADGNISICHPDAVTEVELCDYEKAVEEFYALTTKHAEDTSNILKGQTACKGKVTGTVRVVLDPNHCETFADGDILVTSMTRPEFVPIMKRAGAVVTSEGGITCHAAIISRELRIPCVIGTKTATRFLKDGDLVEVDADNGVVRILNKA